MCIELALRTLYAHYPGQLVLYTPQLAETYGTSVKALVHLIDRGGFPFKPKTFGRKYCVDVFQIAKWLCSHELGEKEEASFDSEEPSSKPIGERVKTIRPSRGKGQSVASKIMQMRHEASKSIARNIEELSDEQERGFLTEFLQELKRLPAMNGFFVKAVWLYTVSDSEKEPQEYTAQFSSLEDSVMHLWEIQARMNDEGSVAIHENGELIYLVCNQLEEEDWTVLVDSAAVDRVIQTINLTSDE